MLALGVVGIVLFLLLFAAPPGTASTTVASARPAMPAESCALSRPAPRLPTWRQVTAAYEFARARRGLVSFAVIDTEGRLYCHHCRRRYEAASLVKAMLLVAYLDRVGAAHRPLADWERALLRAMIRVSDNDAANAIYARVGDSDRLARRVGMRSFDVYGYWSGAQLTAADQARFFLGLDCGTAPRFRAYARAVPSSIVGWQSWGIPEAARPRWRTYFKGGWRPTPNGRLVHQAALLERERLRLAIAVLTVGNPSHEYGVATVRGIAQHLLRSRPRRATAVRPNGTWSASPERARSRGAGASARLCSCFRAARDAGTSADHDAVEQGCPLQASTPAFPDGSSPDGFRNAARSGLPGASVARRVPTQTLATRYELLRPRLADGEQTTVYVVRHPRPQTSLSVEHFAVPQRLERWCRRSGVREAIVGGFFVRPYGPPLGELWIGGRRIETEPVLDPYAGARAAIFVEEGEIHIGPRAELPPRPAGHLLQAGPMLVREGAPLRDLNDPEGFVAGAHQFDSDITSGRHPRAALGTSADELIALVCDGRRRGIDVGLTLAELARLMADLGARQAINLDGGGSTALIHHGHLLNRPYDAQDRPSSNPRAVATAAIFHTTPAQSALSGAA